MQKEINSNVKIEVSSSIEMRFWQGINDFVKQNNRLVLDYRVNIMNPCPHEKADVSLSFLMHHILDLKIKSMNADLTLKVKLYTLLVFNSNTTLFKSALNACHIPFQFPS